jgi:hypothetical protein
LTADDSVASAREARLAAPQVSAIEIVVVATDTAYVSTK